MSDYISASELASRARRQREHLVRQELRDAADKGKNSIMFNQWPDEHTEQLEKFVGELRKEGFEVKCGNYQGRPQYMVKFSEHISKS